jgi:ketosteroid isomerase-like protein
MHARHTLRSRLARLVLTAAAVLPLTAVADPAAAVATAADETERNRQAVTAAFDRWAAGGGNFFAEMLSPDVVWTITGSSPSAGTYRGLDDFRARAVLPFTSRLRTPIRPTARTVWADGDHVIVHWSGEAVAADGLPYRNRYAWILRMRGGQAVEVTAFLDLAPYDDVLRRVPAPGR